jgi:hypothetical protein
MDSGVCGTAWQLTSSGRSATRALGRCEGIFTAETLRRGETFFRKEQRRCGTFDGGWSAAAALF